MMLWYVKIVVYKMYSSNNILESPNKMDESSIEILLHAQLDYNEAVFYKMIQEIRSRLSCGKDKLVTVVMYILGHRGDTMFTRILDVTLYHNSFKTNNNNTKGDMINILMISYILYACFVHSCGLLLKTSYKKSTRLSNYFSQRIPSWIIFEEALTHLAIGICVTDTLDVIGRIHENKNIDLIFSIHDYVHEKYQYLIMEWNECYCSENDSRIQLFFTNTIDNTLSDVIDYIFNQIKNHVF